VSLLLFINIAKKTMTTRTASTLEIVSLRAESSFLQRAVSVIIAYLFWLLIFLLVLLFELKGVIVPPRFWDQLYTWLQVGSLIGLSPILFAVLTWKIVEKTLLHLIKRYKKKHIILE